MWLELLAVAIVVAYLLVRRTFSYWQRMGVQHLPFRIPFGHVEDLGNFRQMNGVLRPSYDQLKSCGAPFVGLYFFHRPMVLALQLDFIKHVLIKDFEYFHDRGLYHNPVGDPLSAHLFSMGGEPWRRMRSRLTPTFTSGKMKFMYPTMLKVARRFESCLDGLVDEGGVELELKDLLARFTTDIIGTCAFGIECNSLADPDGEFRQMGRRVFDKPRHGAFGGLFINSFKRLALWLNMKVVHDEVSSFFLGVVEETVRVREANGISRNDFMDLLIELKNQDGGLSVGEMAAQVFIFFLAGFETSSTTMMFALYELALNEEVQERTRTEIRAVLQRHGGEFTYEAMLEMQYLDQVINETLRKYPPVGTLMRKAAKDYPVPGTSITLRKDTTVLIPAYAIQHDPNHYPEPERFDPERFGPEQRANRDLVSYLPFGQGPRNCIGLRFGMMQTRIGLVTMLCNYRISRAEKTVVPMRFSKKDFLLTAEGGMWLRMTKIAAE